MSTKEKHSREWNLFLIFALFDSSQLNLPQTGTGHRADLAFLAGGK
jgi:hypothetical protein